MVEVIKVDYMKCCRGWEVIRSFMYLFVGMWNGKIILGKVLIIFYKIKDIKLFEKVFFKYFLIWWWGIMVLRFLYFVLLV